MPLPQRRMRIRAPRFQPRPGVCVHGGRAVGSAREFYRGGGGRGGRREGGLTSGPCWTSRWRMRCCTSVARGSTLHRDSPFCSFSACRSGQNRWSRAAQKAARSQEHNRCPAHAGGRSKRRKRSALADAAAQLMAATTGQRTQTGRQPTAGSAEIVCGSCSADKSLDTAELQSHCCEMVNAESYV